MKLKRTHTDEHISINPLSINDLLELSKLSQEEYWEYISQKIPTDNVVDALLGIFTLRQLSFGPYIELAGSNSIKYYISNIVDSIRSIPAANVTTTIDGYTLTLAYPRNTQDPIAAVVRSIQFLRQTINFDELSQSECEEIIENLPPRVVQSVLDFISMYDQPIVLIPENTKLGIKQLAVNLFDTSIEQLAYTLFRGMTTNNILEIVFRLSAHVTDTQFILSRTPQEIEFLQRLASEQKQPK